jgi:kumamolisin
MKKLMVICCSIVIGIAAVPVLCLSAPDSGQTPGYEVQDQVGVATPYVAPPSVFVPDSSKANPWDAGKFAHTNYVIRNFTGTQPQSLEELSVPEPAANPRPDATYAEYPASLACLYKMGPTYAGCVPVNNAAYNAVGGNRAIAIVIAYHNPYAKVDLDFFRSYFGLPAIGTNWKLVKVMKPTYPTASCTSIPFNSGWALESALDTQWSGAMAPSARIILVEACDNSIAQLMLAEQVAIQQVNLYGGGQVSNSWGSGEWSGETSYDYIFRSYWASGKPVSFFFSAGDSGLGAQYPSSSPWVVSAGGTTINRSATTGYFQSESCWAGSGGGTSTYETYSSTWGTGTGPWTNFQYPLFGMANRRTPDISFDADPASGVWVRYAGAWYTVGGTSVSAPALAGIVNNSNNRLGVAPSGGGYFTNAENNLLYSELLTYKEKITNFYDVTTGSNGASALPGWDYCTGVGSPRGKLGK